MILIHIQFILNIITIYLLNYNYNNRLLIYLILKFMKDSKDQNEQKVIYKNQNLLSYKQLARETKLYL